MFNIIRVTRNSKFRIASNAENVFLTSVIVKFRKVTRRTRTKTIHAKTARKKIKTSLIQASNHSKH